MKKLENFVDRMETQSGNIKQQISCTRYYQASALNWNPTGKIKEIENEQNTCGKIKSIGKTWQQATKLARNRLR